jgi:hypothetical protein
VGMKPDLATQLKLAGLPEPVPDQRAKGMAEDIEKYSEALLLGWKVIRVTHVHVRNGKALEWVQKALAAEGVRDG